MLIVPEIMKIAEDIAKESLCIRRQYGVVIADGPVVWAKANNTRVGRCCDNGICIRDTDNLDHGSTIERGAEIHAETAAIFNWGKYRYYTDMADRKPQIYLAGFRKGEQLKGDKCRPCHYCCMQLIYSGFDNYIVKNANNDLVFASIWEVMEEYEETYYQDI